MAPDRLHVELAGVGSESTGTPPLVLLHGFTQTARSWGRFGEALGAGRVIAAVDLAGHGASSAVVATDLWDTAGQVVDAVTAAGLDGAFDLCGYSLGGRVALHVALAHGDRLSRLVLLSTTGGIDDPEIRAQRRARDEQLADEIESEADVSAFVERWLTQPLFAGLDHRSAELDDRLRNTPAGLASSLRSTGTGTQEPLWGQLPEVTTPTLVVTGASDVRFTRIGQRLRDALRAATLATVAGSGHAVHLEQPDLTARLVSTWLDGVGR